MRPHGALVVHWQSNPDTCGQAGLCGRSGSLAFSPGTVDARLTVDSSFAALELFPASATARSYRAIEGQPAGTCIDSVDFPGDLSVSWSPRTRRTTFSFDSAGLTSGRCAGPLPEDFKSALPKSKPVTLKALRSGGLIDMRGRKSFAAGAFRGEVVSTLAFRSGRLVGERQSSSGSGGPVPQGRLVRYGVVAARYDIRRFAGDAGYRLAGAGGDPCQAFDTCGLNGELSMHADTDVGTVVLTSLRRLAPGVKETVASGLRALRAGSTDISGEGTLGTGLLDGPDAPAFPVTETVTPDGGETCSATSSFSEPLLDVRGVKAGVAIRLEHAGDGVTDVLRTRCPGPSSDDIGSAFASGTLPLGAFGSKALSITLAPRPSATAPGLETFGHDGFTLSLDLTSLQATTRVQPIIQRGDFG